MESTSHSSGEESAAVANPSGINSDVLPHEKVRCIDPMEYCHLETPDGTRYPFANSYPNAPGSKPFNVLLLKNMFGEFNMKVVPDTMGEPGWMDAGLKYDIWGVSILSAGPRGHGDRAYCNPDTDAKNWTIIGVVRGFVSRPVAEGFCKDFQFTDLPVEYVSKHEGDLPTQRREQCWLYLIDMPGFVDYFQVSPLPQWARINPSGGLMDTYADGRRTWVARHLDPESLRFYGPRNA